MRDFAFQRFVVNLPVADEDGGAAFKHAREARGAEQHAHHQPVDGQQAEGADDSAGDRVVVADDGVLHGVGERQQHHQVKGLSWASSRLPKMRSSTTSAR